MRMISFYPGPSRIYSNLTEYIYDAQMEGVLSINHRSDGFMALFAKTKKVLRDRLNIPEDYGIAFVSSATEAWEITAQSLVRERSLHLYNGSFGEKWANYTEQCHPIVRRTFPIDELPDAGGAEDVDTLCLVHNETSNGTFLPTTWMENIRRNFESIIAIDATSSMAGVELDWTLGDFWFASVQKCFGLPAGMAILVYSPQALKRAMEVGDNHYNSLSFIAENAEKNQTHHTPNVLGIYLLYRSQKFSSGIEDAQTKLLQRYQHWKTLGNELAMKWLIDNEAVRSRTVLTFSMEQPERLLDHALSHGLILGKGYGHWRQHTLRIANFPAIKSKEIDKLERFLMDYFNY